MPRSTAATVDDYLGSLPADRRAALTAVRDLINTNLPDGYVEGIQYGMPCWSVPLSRYPDTYNGQPLGIVGFASQKQYMALYLLSVYGDPKLEAWFKSAYAKSGKKLDMGKSCLRFKSLDHLALDVVSETLRKVSVDDFLARYEAVQAKAGKARAKRKSASKKSASKKSASKNR